MAKSETLSRRGFFGLLAAAPAVSFGYSTRARDLVAQSNVIDMLGLLTLDWPLLTRWQTDPESFHETDFNRIRQSGIDVFHPAVAFESPRSYDLTLDCISKWNRLISRHPDYFVRIDDPADLAEARSQRKIGIILGTQDATHLRSVGDVDAFYRMGQRVSQLTYNSVNRLGAGCMAAHDSGLTGFGGDIVARMNAIRMAIDVSHCGERTTLDAIEASEKPVLITHTNCRALVPSVARCKPDEAIRAAARKGGVIGLTSVRHFVRAKDPVTIEDLLDHFDHTIQVAGIEHVGIGSDLDLKGRDTSAKAPRYDIAGLCNTDRIYELTEGFIRRGYTDEHIGLLLGRNFERALRQIWS